MPLADIGPAVPAGIIAVAVSFVSNPSLLWLLRYLRLALVVPFPRYYSLFFSYFLSIVLEGIRDTMLFDRASPLIKQ